MSQANLSSRAPSHQKNKQMQYDPLTIRRMTNESESDYLILLALYEHRMLSASQMHTLVLSTYTPNSVRNRLNLLFQRNLLNRLERTGKNGKKIIYYSLSTFGLRILTEEFLDVPEYCPDIDDIKYHFTLDDLRVKSQHNHFFLMQDWLASLLSQLRERDIFIPHCEWKRFPMFDDEENVPYKPDWLFFKPSVSFIELIKNKDLNKNPLLMPYRARLREFDPIDYQPWISVECDTGTMSKSLLVDKWNTVKKFTQFECEAIVIFHPTEDQKHKNNRRHYNVRDSLFIVFEDELNKDSLTLIEGDEHSTLEATQVFIQNDRKLLPHDMNMLNHEQLHLYVQRYNSTLVSREMSLMPPSIISWAVEAKLPVEPDRVILAKENEEEELHFIFFVRKGWVNPYSKVRTLIHWIRSGNLKEIVKSAKIVVLYPNSSERLGDIHLKDESIYYADFERVVEEGQWGTVHRRIIKNKNIRWVEEKI